MIDAEEMKCPKISDLIKNTYFSCENHQWYSNRCAGRTALALKKFIINKKYSRVFDPKNMAIDHDEVDL